jgi:hypothetical protein
LRQFLQLLNGFDEIDSGGAEIRFASCDMAVNERKAFGEALRTISRQSKA